MNTIIPETELLRRAVLYIAEQRKADPKIHMTQLLDDASMRFNLSPLESASLQRLLCNATTDQYK